MTPEQRAIIARQNGAKSRGPISPMGKGISSRNATTHGMYSNRALIRGESAATLDALIRLHTKAIRPQSPEQNQLTTEIAEMFWRMRRALRLECQALVAASTDLGCTNPATLESRFSVLELGVRTPKSRIEQMVDTQSRLSRKVIRTIRKLKTMQKRASKPEFNLLLDLPKIAAAIFILLALLGSSGNAQPALHSVNPTKTIEMQEQTYARNYRSLFKSTDTAGSLYAINFSYTSSGSGS